MKIKYVLPLAAVTILAGCSHFKVAGTNFDTYIQKNGVPTSEYTMQNGNKLYTYKTLCPNNKNWQEYTVEVSPDNIIVNRKYIKNCTYWSELDSYIQKHGVPTSEYEMQNGNKLYTYKSLCADRITWQEYNIEVNPQNNIVKKTDVRSCPDTQNITNYHNINNLTDSSVLQNEREISQPKYVSLSNEWSEVNKQKQIALSDWTKSAQNKGLNHKDTIAAKQKYENLRKKSEQLFAEMEQELHTLISK